MGEPERKGEVQAWGWTERPRGALGTLEPAQRVSWHFPLARALVLALTDLPPQLSQQKGSSIHTLKLWEASGCQVPEQSSPHWGLFLL